jgi:hypothetical protein
MLTVSSTSPTDAREQCYWLLTKESPRRVVVDSDLGPGQWYVVRAPSEYELAAARRLNGVQGTTQAQEPAHG